MGKKPRKKRPALDQMGVDAVNALMSNTREVLRHNVTMREALRAEYLRAADEYQKLRDDHERLRCEVNDVWNALANIPVDFGGLGGSRYRLSCPSSSCAGGTRHRTIRTADGRGLASECLRCGLVRSAEERRPVDGSAEGAVWQKSFRCENCNQTSAHQRIHEGSLSDRWQCLSCDKIIEVARP